MIPRRDKCDRSADERVCEMIKDWIDRHFEEHLKLLKELAAIPAPSHKEDKRVRFLTELLSSEGIYAYTDEAKNVIVPMGEGDGACVYSAHTDVVFPDETPLPVREENGLLYAPGVGDDTANAAAIVTIIRYVKEHGLKAKRPVLFVFNSCEEGLGNLKGTRQLLRDSGSRISEFVSFDCSLEEGMVTRAVGSERWRVTVKTAGGHSYSAFGKPNAIHRMARFVDALYSQEVPQSEGSRTTYNAGLISGGTSINTIAPEAELYYEYRSDDHRHLAAMQNSFKRLLNEADTPEAAFSAELIGERPCGANVDDAAMEKLIGRCSRAITGVTGRPIESCSASTDANIPLSLGIPAVTFGLYSGGGAHTRGEWLSIDSLKTGLEIGISLVLDGHFLK